MSKKGIITILAILIIIVLAVLLFGDREELQLVDQEQGEVEENINQTQAETAEGTITAIDTEQAMVDGPYTITLDSGTVIALPSMGILLCKSGELASIGDLEVGQKVEVRGSPGPNGQIVPCESANHYLRIVE